MTDDELRTELKLLRKIIGDAAIIIGTLILIALFLTLMVLLYHH